MISKLVSLPMLRLAWEPSSMDEALKEMHYTAAAGSRTMKGVKKAMRKEMIKWHPDTCKQAPDTCLENAKRVSNAYTYVKNNEADLNTAGFRGRSPGGFGGSPHRGWDSSDPFGQDGPFNWDPFGGRSRRPGGGSERTDQSVLREARHVVRDLNSIHSRHEFWHEAQGLVMDINLSISTYEMSPSDKYRDKLIRLTKKGKELYSHVNASDKSDRFRQEKRAKDATKLIAIIAGSALAYRILYVFFRKTRSYKKLQIFFDDLKRKGWFPGLPLTKRQKRDLLREVHGYSEAELDNLVGKVRKIRRKAT